VTTICLTFDFDAAALWVSTFSLTTPTPVSRGEFGANVGLPRILSLLSTYNIKSTFFVPAHTAAAFPNETRSIIEAGHEIAVHGYCHESPVGLSLDEERSLLDRSVSKLIGIIGSDYVPKGYRSPAWDLTENSISLLVERGFIYDSSMMADDFRPYFARMGDKVDEEDFIRGAVTSLVEIPVAWELDDFPYFTHLSRPIYQGLRNPDDVLNCWKSEFDFCNAHVTDGVFTLTLHPQIIGRGPRILMLEKLISHMKQQTGARFQTLEEVAAQFSALEFKDCP
jgi:peptidoglycan/xylan/chitin deacetylase (PgdA/CDA1 family)